MAFRAHEVRTITHTEQGWGSVHTEIVETHAPSYNPTFRWKVYADMREVASGSGTDLRDAKIKVGVARQLVLLLQHVAGKCTDDWQHWAGRHLEPFRQDEIKRLRQWDDPDVVPEGTDTTRAAG